MDDRIPPFLTVEEASRLLKIGRTKAYELTKEWRATGGRSGLPVVDLGDVLRVPGPAIEQMLGIGLGTPCPTTTGLRSRSTRRTVKPTGSHADPAAPDHTAPLPETAPPAARAGHVVVGLAVALPSSALSSRVTAPTAAPTAPTPGPAR